ncbi:MAG: methionine-R-sulfoxide reductase [Chlamydiales bacterium]|jgi:methionine-R-sulfoxide reductase
MSETPDDTHATTEEEWRARLTPEQYRVCRERGTEPAFSGKYWDCNEQGIYRCSCCESELFRSDDKFDSGCGWPSFFQAADDGRIATHEDLSHGMRRVEVTCKKCGSHLGHVFDDGPQPTGVRYCINSLSVELEK